MVALIERGALQEAHPAYWAPFVVVGEGEHVEQDFLLEILELREALEAHLEQEEQGLFRDGTEPEPAYTETLDFDLAAVVPSLAGPRRPQDRVSLPRVGDSFAEAFGAARSAASPSGLPSSPWLSSPPPASDSGPREP